MKGLFNSGEATLAQDLSRFVLTREKDARALGRIRVVLGHVARGV
jgi:hypothetical protein